MTSQVRNELRDDYKSRLVNRRACSVGFVRREMGRRGYQIHQLVDSEGQYSFCGHAPLALQMMTQGVSANFAPSPASFSNAVPVLLGRIKPMHPIQKVVTRKRKGDDDAAWTYWVTRPVTERLAMVEELRAEYHGWTHEPEPRLSRICRIIRRS